MIEVTHICKSYQGIRALDSRELMRVFRDMELIEQLGSGMRRILDAYGRDAFEIDDNFICVTFPFSQEALGLNDDLTVGDDTVEDRECADGRFGEVQVGSVNGTVKWHSNLTEREKDLLSLLNENPHITYEGAASALGLSRRTVARAFAALSTKGIIAREGSDKNGVWSIFPESE